MWSMFIGWVNQTDSVRLEDHTVEARRLIEVFVLLLIIAALVAWVGGATFLFTHLPPDWPPFWQIAGSAVGGLAWACIIVFVIDRALLIVTDSLFTGGHWLRRGAWSLLLLGIRLGVAVLLNLMVANWIMLSIHADAITIALGQTAKEVIAADTEAIFARHKVSELRAAEGRLEEQLAGQTEQRKAIPLDVNKKEIEALKADKDAVALARLVTRREQDPNADPIQLQRLRIALDKKRTLARELKREAQERADGWTSSMDRQRDETQRALAATRADLRAATTRATSEIATSSQRTEASYSNRGLREMGFQRVRADHPDIARSASIFAAVLVMIELLPIIIKLLPLNNPVAQDVKHILGLETARRRIAAHQVTQEEAIMIAALERRDVIEHKLECYARIASAFGEVQAFRRVLLEELRETQKALRQVAKTHPQEAGMIRAMLLRAFEDALLRLSRLEAAE